MAGEGAGKSAGEAAAPHSFPRKAPLASTLAIFAALLPAPSSAIFWLSPFLYSVEGRPDLKTIVYCRLHAAPLEEMLSFWEISLQCLMQGRFELLCAAASH